jgi:hypothetical protein
VDGGFAGSRTSATRSQLSRCFDRMLRRGPTARMTLGLIRLAEDAPVRGRAVSRACMCIACSCSTYRWSADRTRCWPLRMRAERHRAGMCYACAMPVRSQIAVMA